MFRFVLWAHALASRPRRPATTGISKFPKSISGASDAGDGGGDFVITLGMWDNNTGTEFVQKSTFVHEFGHTADSARRPGSDATYVGELQAELPELDELPVPDTWADRSEWPGQ